MEKIKRNTRLSYIDHTVNFKFSESIITNNYENFVEEVEKWAKYRQFEEEPICWGTLFSFVSDDKSIGLIDMVGMKTFLIDIVQANIDVQYISETLKTLAL